MIQRCKWANDVIVFSIGDKVLLRIETDGNPKTKARPLKNYQHDAPRTVVRINKDTVDIEDVYGIVEIAVQKSRLIKVIQ